MEFEQYLERDILAFLDSKMQHKNSNIDREEEYGLYLTKDYLKELNYALDNDELTKAKKLFDELKITHSKLPEKSMERKKIYFLLEKMYEKIQDYVKIKEGKIEVIKEGNSEILKDKTDKFSELATNKENVITEDIDMSKTADLPISLNKKSNKATKEKEANSKNEDNNNTNYIEDSKNITNSSNIISSKKGKENIVPESSDTKSSIKDGNKTKYYEEQSEIKEEPEIITQNVFIKTNDNNNNSIIKSGSEFKKFKITKPDFNSNSSIEINYLENEIIEGTIYLEQLKTKIIEKLIDDLHKKMSEKNLEQDKKIETIKKDIMQNIIMELDKRFGTEKTDLSKIENLKGEILNQTYRQAKNIVTTEDNSQNIAKSQNNIIHDITPPNSKVIIKTQVPTNKNSNPTTIEEENNKQTITKNIITLTDIKEDKSHVAYNQAIQNMKDNNYEDAAQLFKNIIKFNPKNKAANIRLNECLEKIKEITPTEIIKISSIPESENIVNKKAIEKNKNNLHVSNSKIRDEFSQYERHKGGNKEIQKMYEKAIYTMFQNNYNEAAKLFQEILRIRPDNKAARIRLQECLEVNRNA
jgi:TolA-binding protein